MAEGTYEFECMRAELLGLDKPDYEEFMKNKKEKEAEAKEVEEEDFETENLKDVEHQNEGMKNVSGGLDELNNILQATQRKINRFKASCGSLTNLLKIKIGQGPADQPSGPNGSNPENVTNETTHDTPQTNGTTNDGGNISHELSENGTPARKSDLSKALDNHVDRLDAMIDKAENAQYSMAHQTKQMKKFLN